MAAATGPDLEARRKEIRSLLDDLHSRLMRGEMEEPKYVELRAGLEADLRQVEEEMRRRGAEAELRRWRRVLGALLAAAGVLLFLATARLLSSATPVAGPSPESSALVFLQWLSVVPMAAGLFFLLRPGPREGEPVETLWTFSTSPQEVRRSLEAALERRGARTRRREGRLESVLGRGGGRVDLALYISGTPTRTEVRVEARLGADVGPSILREIRSDAVALFSGRAP